MHVRSFRLGRQEDAHEYLVSLLDAMHEAILDSIHPKPPREVAQTSFIYRIFGGTCRSQVGGAHALMHIPRTPPFGLQLRIRAGLVPGLSVGFLTCQSIGTCSVTL